MRLLPPLMLKDNIKEIISSIKTIDLSKQKYIHIASVKTVDLCGYLVINWIFLINTQEYSNIYT